MLGKVHLTGSDTSLMSATCAGRLTHVVVGTWNHPGSGRRVVAVLRANTTVDSAGTASTHCSGFLPPARVSENICRLLVRP